VYYEQGSSLNAEIFALKGRNALGTRFVIPWQTVFNNSVEYLPTPYAAFDVVATQDNTVVTVRPSRPIVGHETDSVIRVKLNAGETFSFKKPGFSAAENLAGTIVTSTKPIAISIKDDSVINETCRDALGDQLIPANVAGMEYIVPKGFLRTPEYIFITATEDNTDVYASGISVPVITLNTGQSYRIIHTIPSLYIRATKNVLVIHVTGFGCEVGMAVLPPINCTGSKKISFTRSTDEFFGMTILTRKEALFNFKLTHNGQSEYMPTNYFNEVPGTNGEWYTALFSFDVGKVPVGEASTISNDLQSFQASIINGNAATTCRYGYFSSFSTLSIGDDFKICEGNTATIDAGPGKETYLWSTGATTQSIDVAAPGYYWVRVTREDCTLSDTVHVDVRTGHLDLGPDVEICPGKESNVDGKENFSWLWSDGSTGQYLRTNVTGKYWVNVFDDYGCEASDTIMVNPYSGVVDALVDIKLDYVSVDTAKQENINVAWTVIHPERISAFTVSVYKRIAGDAQWEFASAVEEGIQYYANPGNATSDNSYELYVALADHCLTEQRQSVLHNSILLIGLPDSVNDVISLRWNPYIEWPQGVEKYEVWRKLDQDTVFSFVASVNGTETNFSSQIGADGFIHYYLIRAIEKDGTNDSWSNSVGMEFTHPITVPNVFTPNGDGYNQYFFIPKIELYEDAELNVVDRWGKTVYKSTNGYGNDWDGDDLSSGVYYYILDLNKRNTVIKGIVNIVK
jgi:gliding motility-associated-like protein